MRGKNIVICCDGTGNEYRASENTNVVKLVRALDRRDRTKQIIYYDPGVGTMSAPGVQTPLAKGMTKLLGLVFGYGMTKNISDAYLYLMNHYEPDDRVFLFGFSRGAYTVRALAGMLHMCGLLEKGSDNLVPYAIKVYKERNIRKSKLAQGKLRWLLFLPLAIYMIYKWSAKDTEPYWARAGGFKKTFSSKCEPHFLGVWDTVKSVGWLRRRVVLPYTAKHPQLKYGRHAVSIDEKRSQYKPNLWGYENVIDPENGRDIQQVWFPGVHSDIGGSYDDSGLSDITLRWMIDGAIKYGLLIDAKEYNKLKIGIAQGRLHNPLMPLWWILGFGCRSIPNGAWMHESVKQRRQLTMNDEKPYRPLIPKDVIYVQ